jgi:hypothetical protein
MPYFGIPIRNGLPIGLGSVAGFGVSEQFSPASLFSAGEQGAWYDPSDLTTLFQDSAGGTPVTAVEQPVGRMLDKSGRGNHATQSTSTSRPVLRARYNLLTYSEQFDNAAWTKNAVTAANTTATTDPLGGTTADIITETATTNYHSAYQTATITAGATVTFSCYLKKAAWQYAQINAQSGSISTRWFQCVIDLDTGTITQQSAGSTGTLISASRTDAGNGWWRVVLTGSIPTDTTIYAMVGTVSGGTPTLGNYGLESRLGSTANTIYAWGAQLITTNSLTSNTYQRIVTATVYDSSGFLPYLAFDGTDDSLLTNSVDFTATDKMTVWAGLRKLSDAAQGVVSELSATIASNNGSFLLTAPNSAAANYNWSSKGTTQVDNTVTTYTAPITNVVTGIADIAGASNIIRINGVQVGSVATTQGTGNYGNYPLYIGRRNNATLPLNGNLYSLIIRGAQSSAAQISSTETWVNGKTGAY